MPHSGSGKFVSEAVALLFQRTCIGALSAAQNPSHDRGGTRVYTEGRNNFWNISLQFYALTTSMIVLSSP